MKYREWKPAAALAGHVQCFWTLEGTPLARAPELICPDGLIEMIFHLAEPFSVLDSSGAVHRQPRSLLIGPADRALRLMPSMRARILGVRFHTGGAWSFLHFPQHQAAGQVLDFEAVLGAAAARLRQRLGEARDWAAAIALVETFLLGRFREQPCIHKSGHLSRRQHRRRFREAVGLHPKLFQRIVRFQRALRDLGSARLADIASDCGYSDQAHLTREFKEFSGCTPTEHLRLRHPLADHFVLGS